MDIAQRIDAAVDAALGRRIVGCVILVSRRGEPVHSRTAGFADREAGRRMQEDAIFRLASVTKPIVAAAALRLIDQGRLTLDDPVARHLPFFTPPAPGGGTAEMTIRHLLTHTSGLTYDTVPPDVSAGIIGPEIPLQENLRRLARHPLAFAPGTAWGYGTSIDVLGGVVEAITGTTLGEAVADLVTGPLGMADTIFGVTDPARLAKPYGDSDPPHPMGEPETLTRADGTSTTFSPGRIFISQPQSGGAGMAGSAADVLRLLEGLRAGPFLTDATRAAAFANQIGDLPRRPGDAGKRFCLLGALMADPAAAGSPAPAGTVDWGGVWGHHWIIDPGSGTTVVTCTNTAFEGCNGAFRDEITQAVFG